MAEEIPGSAPEEELEEAPAIAARATVAEPAPDETAAEAQAQTTTSGTTETATEAARQNSRNENREALLPRRSRSGKVMTNGFRLPGFSGFSDLPGKVCVKCGFNAMKFSKQCPRCGGDLVPESAPTS